MSSCRPAVLVLSHAVCCAVLRCAMRTINRAALLWSARKARSRWPVSGLARPGMLLAYAAQPRSEAVRSRSELF